MKRITNSRDKKIPLPSGIEVEKQLKLAKQVSNVKTLFGVIISGTTALLKDPWGKDVVNFVKTLSLIIKTIFPPEAFDPSGLLEAISVDYTLIGTQEDISRVADKFQQPLIYKEFLHQRHGRAEWIVEWAKQDKSLIGIVPLLQAGGKTFLDHNLAFQKTKVKDIMVNDEFSPFLINARLLNSFTTGYDTIITTEGKTGFWTTYYGLKALHEQGLPIPKEIIILRDSIPALFQQGFVPKTMAEDICFDLAIHDLVRVYDASLPTNTRFVLVPQLKETKDFIILSLVSRKILELFRDETFMFPFDLTDWEKRERINFEIRAKQSRDSYWLGFYPSKKTPITDTQIKDIPEMFPERKNPQRPIIVRTFAIIEKSKLRELLYGTSDLEELKQTVWSSIKTGLGLIGNFHTEDEFRKAIKEAIYFSTMTIYIPEIKDFHARSVEALKINSFIGEIIEHVDLPDTLSRIVLTPVLNSNMSVVSKALPSLKDKWVVSFDLYINSVYLVDSLYRLGDPFRKVRTSGGNSQFYQRSFMLKLIIKTLLPGAIYVRTPFTGMTGEIPALVAGLFKRNHGPWKPKIRPSWSDKDNEIASEDDDKTPTDEITFNSVIE